MTSTSRPTPSPSSAPHTSQTETAGSPESAPRAISLPLWRQRLAERPPSADWLRERHHGSEAVLGAARTADPPPTPSILRSMPRLYVCVYRHHVPGAGEWHQTVERSRENATLARFLSDYWSDDTYFDWGDDPSFFGALDSFGDARRASWAVCRPNVRERLAPGDGVVFFVVKPNVSINRRGTRVPAGPADYFYIGHGTVGEIVDRQLMWTDEKYGPYRTLFNALARPADGAMENVEVFPKHPDWSRRASAPVILFEPSGSLFDLEAPPRVARYDPVQGFPERWSDDATSQALQRLLFTGLERRLRTSEGGHPHPHMRFDLTPEEFAAKRFELLQLIREGLSG